MSHPRVILPATGGGALLAGIFCQRFTHAICGILLGLTALTIVRTIKGQAELWPQKQDKH